MKVNKIFWITLGFLSFVIGVIGAILPLLPSFPFLLLAAFCFGKSSQKLHSWFCSTHIYKKNLESYLSGKGMTVIAKIKLIFMVTVVMGVGFVMMFLKQVYIPCLILAVVWFGHVIYFIFGVKTIK